MSERFRDLAPGVWRYAARLPTVPAEHRVTLGEGATPLIAAPRLAAAAGLATLYLKLESQNPTGSFKDRGTAVAISEALATGASHVVEDSSGNAGAAAAAYAARSGMRCTVFVPASTPAAKLRQIEAYGALVQQMAGTRADVAAAARREAGRLKAYHLDHNASAAFAAGSGTAGLELAEALREIPALLLPVGGGSLLAGCFEAFRSLLSEGALAALPPLYAVQTEACAPLVAALERGWEQPMRVEPGATVAGGITIADPPRGPELLLALRQSHGGAVAVDDAAILRWGRLLSRLEGVYAEPTSAAAVAGLAKLVAMRRIAADGAAVVLITGSGLKDPG